MIYIGLPQWSHPKWLRLGITSLADYARHFNCVEGNTTLYALPKAEIVARWYEQTHDNFRFCFKFPATISHQAALRHCDDLSHEFFYSSGAAGNAYWPVLAAAARHLWPRRPPCPVALSRYAADPIHLWRRSTASRVFRQRGRRKGAQSRAASTSRESRHPRQPPGA